MIAIRKNPLADLSDSQIIRRLDDLVQKERETTLEVIRHIIEFDRRKLYLGLGHSSLFDYCTLQLGYSASSAMRRIQTARTIIEFPEVLKLLETSELNLTGVCLLADALTPENKDELLQEARCKSKRRIEQIVARFKPGKEIPEKIRTVFVSSLIGQPESSRTGRQQTFEDSTVPVPCACPSDPVRKNSEKSTTAGGGRKLTTGSGSPQQTPILKKKYKLEFAVEPGCMKKIEEAKALLSRKYPVGVPLGILLEEALDAYLDKHSPKRKKQRRDKREAKKKEKKIGRRNAHAAAANAKNSSKTHNSVSTSKKTSKNKFSRHIPQAIQDAVAEREGGRCAFTGPDGRRCNSTWNLEIDHIVPFAQGGNHSLENLRLLCARHNKYEAEKCYGREFINRRVQGRNPRRE